MNYNYVYTYVFLLKTLENALGCSTLCSSSSSNMRDDSWVKLVCCCCEMKIVAMFTVVLGKSDIAVTVVIITATVEYIGPKVT